MAYILNQPVNDNKKFVVALNEIFGLGKRLIYQVCDQLGLSYSIKIGELNASQIDRLTRCISQNYIIGASARRVVQRNKERFISISSYRGFRYIDGLPCRGQRTHTNAQTVRKRSTVQRSNSSLLGEKRKKRVRAPNVK